MEERQRSVPMVMAIAVDKQKKCEHIVIGAEYKLRSFLQGYECAEVLYNEERELGSFLVDHQKQLDKDWNIGCIYPLKQALLSLWEQKTQKATAEKFLAEKEKSHDPVSIFTAYMCRYWYTENSSVIANSKKADAFEEKVLGLTSSFKQELWDGRKYYLMDELLNKAQEIIHFKRSSEDAEARIWYSRRKQNLEYVIVKDSFYPAILYYLTRLKELKYCFCQCSVCGRLFIAPSGHYSLCSDGCRESKNLQNKREFEERARKNRYNSDCKNTTQRIRNRINRLSKQNAPEDLQHQVEVAFRAFQKEALMRKKNIKSGADSKYFTDWLFKQEQMIDDLCGG